MDDLILRNSALLTWIIPVYNGEKYIGQAIRSLLRQPCRDFDIIVVNDGSTDNTLRILSAIDCPRLRVISKVNGGVSSARNCGIQAATSRYIAFLDADDIICKNAYDETIHTLLLEEKYDLISFPYYSGDQELKYGNLHPITAGELQCEKAQLDPFRHCSSFIYHRCLFERNPALRFPEGIRIREDVAFQYLVYQHAGNIIGLDKNWFIYRNNAASVLHRNESCDYISHYAIPAWKWCRDLCEHPEAKQHCDIRIFSEAVAHIQACCMAGIPLRQVREVFSLPPVRDSLANYDLLWNGNKQEYESFMENPGRYWRKHRLIGLATGIARSIVRIPFFRKYYLRMRYSENIEAIV